MSSDDRKAFCLNDGVTKTGLVNALDFIHETIEEYISTANDNQATQGHVDDCRKTEGFVESCRLLASFSVHNSLETEAKALVQLTRNGSACFAETINDEEGLLKGFQLITEIASVFETLELAILSLECAKEDQGNPETPFEVCLESDKSSNPESIVFDPSQWNRVACKLYESGWDSAGAHYTHSGDEDLYTDDSKIHWIIIRSQQHSELPGYVWQTYYYLTGSDLSKWIIGSEAIPPYSLKELIPGKTLTPDTLHMEAPRDVSWNGSELLVDGEIVAEFAARAKNMRPILDAFQKNDWVSPIEDPLSEGHLDPSGRLNETNRSLNDKQKVIRFFCDGTGKRVGWKFM